MHLNSHSSARQHIDMAQFRLNLGHIDRTEKVSHRVLLIVSGYFNTATRTGLCPDVRPLYLVSLRMH